MGLIEQIQGWYAAQCNGDWEHQYGLSIDTLDNPGWSVTVDLNGTSLEHIVFQTVHEDKGEDDWIICEVSGNKFVCSLLKDCRIVTLPMPFAGGSIGSICYALNWMVQVLTIQYYANFALGYLKAERNESCSTKYYLRCVIRNW